MRSTLKERLHCQRCDTELPEGAHFCPECGTSADLVLIDPFDLDEPPVPAETETAPRRGRGLWALLAVMAVTVGVLWSLSMLAESPGEQSAVAESSAPATTRGSAPPASMAATTATPATTTAPPSPTSTTTAPTSTTTAPTSTEAHFVGGSPGPVLTDDIDGSLVQLGNEVRTLDLSSGQVEVTPLEYPVWRGNEGFLDDMHVSLRQLSFLITDLNDGSQLRVDTSDWGFHHGESLLGWASGDSFWLRVWDDRPDGVVEVGLDGQIRRRVEIPEGFWPRWADGDEMTLSSFDGHWRYAIATGAVERLPALVGDFGSQLSVTCDGIDRCIVHSDDHSGPGGVEIRRRDIATGMLFVAPDRSGFVRWAEPSLVGGETFRYYDLDTGSVRDLGAHDIDPEFGLVWIDDFTWIIGQQRSFRSPVAEAIDLETGDTVTIEFHQDAVGRGPLTYLPHRASPPSG